MRKREIGIRKRKIQSRMKLDIIYNEDCLEGMGRLPNKSVNLVIADSPYNIGKAEWDRIPNYVSWCGKWILECQRVLKDNGSFYWFHNCIPTISRLMVWIEEDTDFVFKQFIVWNKKFKGVKNEGYLQGYNEVDGLRNYQRMAEYLLFYTFQDETGLTTIMLDINNFSSLRQYFKGYQEALDIPKKQIIELVGQKADHCFRWKSSQWDLPTEETYKCLSNIPLKYEFVRREYEDLRREYEGLRYTFNNQKTHHSVWNYEIAEKSNHLTPKPIPLTENILRHSSNEGDIVLIPFVGGGNDCIACKHLNRHYIGFEINPEYCEIAQQRLEAEKKEAPDAYQTKQ